MSKSPIQTEKTDYLSHRPFLVIDLYHTPASHIKTHVKNWGNEPRNWRTSEHPYLVDRITYKHATRASVIIDVLNKKIIKNRFQFESSESNNEILEHYSTKYASHIAEAMNIWSIKEGIASYDKSEKTAVTITM